MASIPDWFVDQNKRDKRWLRMLVVDLIRGPSFSALDVTFVLVFMRGVVDAKTANYACALIERKFPANM